MEKKNTKKEIVRMLLNKSIEIEDEEELLDLLIDQPIAIDVDKEEELNAKKGDKVAIVSLSWGGLGDKELIHKYYIAKERLERDFGLEVVIMPHA